MIVGACILAALPLALYVLYLDYCALRVARDNGKLAAAPRIVRAVAWAILALAVALDWLFNLTWGSALFREAPARWRELFTGRCARWRDDTGWRGARARWFCDGWLNPFEPGHC